MTLDSPQSCIEELAQINKELGGFGHLWASDAGNLKEALVRYERLRRAALRGITEDLKVAEKDAVSHAAVEQTEPGLAEGIEELEGRVETHKTLFKVLERRSSNAQSILAALRAEARMPQEEPQWSGAVSP